MSSAESAGKSTNARLGAAATPQEFLRLMRPGQWIKNIVVFVGPAAGLRLFTLDGFGQAMVAFGAFCLASSATYAINDVLDRNVDALHPSKRDRPVARGAVSPVAAVFLAFVLLGTAVLMVWTLLPPAVLAIVMAYFALTLTYSIALKAMVILDVIVIATGFVLRAWAGAAAVGVATSEWLIICMFTLCLFMGFGKRRCEISMLRNGDDLYRHRSTLIRYTPDLLNHLITVAAGIAVMTFLIYTLDKTRPAPFPKEQLFLTLPLVVYGLFRYAMVTELGLYAGPTEIVLKDKPLIAVIVLWSVTALAIAYQKFWMPYLGWSSA